MRKKILYIIAGIGTFFGFLGIFGAIYFTYFDPGGGDHILQWIETNVENGILPIAVGVFFTMMTIAAFSPFFMELIKTAQRKKRLQKIGHKMMAQVVKVEDTGITINNNPYVKITVETIKGIQGSFTITISRVSRIMPGDAIEVYYNPANPSEVVPI